MDMRRDLLVVKRERFDLTDKRKYILQGIWPRDAKVEAVFAGQELETLASLLDQLRSDAPLCRVMESEESEEP